MTDEFSEYDDEQLVKCLVETRNTKYFGALYDRYAKKIYNRCLSFTQTKGEAEDLTHDIFVKIHFKLFSFKFNSKLSTWLYSVTYNFCIDHVKRTKKNQDTIEEYVELENDNTDPEDSVIFQIQVERLRECLDLLVPDEKVLLLLKYQDGLSIKELSEMTNLNESAIKMRLKRAKARLLKIYKERYERQIINNG